MSVNTIFIIESNFLVRKGLIAIIKSLNFNTNIIEIENINLIFNILQDNRPDLIFINAKEISSEKIVSILTNHKIILLTDCNIYNNYELTIIEELKFSDNEEAIIKKLKDNIFHIFQNNENERNEDLSQREIEIVENVALGLTNQEIADKLFLSPHTVITHRKNITKKLGIKTVSGLTVYALLNNIISLDSKPIN